MFRTNIIEKFLALLRYALWNQKMPLSLVGIDEYDGLIRVSYEQAVAGLILDLLLEQSISMRHDTLFQSIGNVSNIKNQNLILNRELTGFVDFLNNYNIPYIVVKGQVAAQWYKKPVLRQSGDIDVYIPYNNFEYAQKSIFNEFHVEMKMDVFEKHSEFVLNGVIYELHQDLVQFSSRRHQSIWEKLLENDVGGDINLDGKTIKTLSPTLSVLYIFIHLFLHLIQSGVGLRQVCDLTMCLHHYHHVMNKKDLEKNLAELGLTKAFLSIGAIMIDALGLPSEEFPFNTKSNHHRIGQKILKDMLKMGNFGKNVDVVKQTGLMHSIQTGLKIILQSCKYVTLAPKEVMLRFPRMCKIYIKHSSFAS